LGQNGLACTSWFVFDESGGLDDVRPPLNRALANASFAEAIDSSQYFRDVRELLESVCRSILSTYGPPDQDSLKKARVLLNPFLDRMRALVPGPLSIFTTNFDQVIELTLAPEGEHLYNGLAHEPSAAVQVQDQSSS